MFNCYSAPDQHCVVFSAQWQLPAYCIASVTIPDRFICFILAVKQSAGVFAGLSLCFEGDASTFLRKEMHPVTWLENFLK